MEFEITIVNYGLLKVRYGSTIREILKIIQQQDKVLKNKFEVVLPHNVTLRGPATFILSSE